ncbi:MAG TPA: hypothetical protein VEW03_07435, partial [Longimicrobiaceae bacterium]|nr:hypothetical protein [Longimicrobiaceae bacterium]
MTRYLVPVFMQSALHRGKSVAQFLGGFMHGEGLALRWIELRPGEEDGVEVWVHEVHEDGDGTWADIGEFAPLDDDADEPV